MTVDFPPARRLLGVLCALSISISLAACEPDDSDDSEPGGDTDTTSVTDTAPPEGDTDRADTVSPDDTAQSDDFAQSDDTAQSEDTTATDMMADAVEPMCGECGPEETCCGEQLCVDTMTDAQHCGACNNACTSDQACDAGTCRPTVPYRYVIITDKEPAGSLDETDAGSDIDAIVLEKPDGTLHYAVSLEGLQLGAGGSQDPNRIIDAPDAFTAFPDVSTCSDSGVLSMGGGGAYALVQMSAAIENGDVLHVLELGNCTLDDGTMALAEQYDVAVSVSSDVSATSAMVGSGAGPLSVTLADLPVVFQ